MKLKPVGFFQELNHGDPDGPKLVDSVGHSQPDEQKIVLYLRNGLLFVGCPCFVDDVLDKSSVQIASPHLFTDGEWAWPGDLPYYLERYHVALPNDFLESVRQKDFRSPTDQEVDIATLELWGSHAG